MGKGAAGNVDAPQVIPIGQNEGDTTRKKFPTLLGAVSQIQQFYFIEKKGQEISDDFLTIQGKMNFLQVGVGSGFVEGLAFAVLTAIVVPILSDPEYMVWLGQYFPLVRSRLFLWTLKCFPVLITGGLCCFIARYRVGMLTRKAVDHLLVGRVISLIAKGIIIFFGLMYMSQMITPNRAWTAAKWVSLKHYSLATEIYRIVMNTKPNMVDAAYETIAIFTIAILLPFVSVWCFSLVRSFKKRRDKRRWGNF